MSYTYLQYTLALQGGRVAKHVVAEELGGTPQCETRGMQGLSQLGLVARQCNVDRSTVGIGIDIDIGIVAILWYTVGNRPRKVERFQGIRIGKQVGKVG